LLESDDQSVSQFQRRIMPHTFREVVDSGTTFSQMVATPPLCCPSRAATITGDYPHNSGVMDNGQRAYPKLTDKANVLPVWLQRAGYRTALVGKFIDGYTNVGGLNPAPGWNRWFVQQEPKSYWAPTLVDQHRIRKYGPRTYLTDVLNREAERFVRRQSTQHDPFFLWYAPWAPHKGKGNRADKQAPVCRRDGKPLPHPREYRRFENAPAPDLSYPSFDEADLSDKPAPYSDLPRLSAAKVAEIKARWRCGAAALATFDEGIRRIVRTLRRTGTLRNTMIIYTSDNGAFFGEHRVPRGKIRPSEDAARVPTVIHPAATQIPPHKAESDQPVGMIDIAPTILDAADAKPCNQSGCRAIDGTSMWPLLSDPDSSTWSSKRGLLLELDHKNCSYEAVRTRTHTYVRYRKPIRREKPPFQCPGTGATELYDRANDPFELHNLQGTDHKRALLDNTLSGLILSRRLKALVACSGHPGSGAAKPCE
jgi:arylsulfatase A-like enzyme